MLSFGALGEFALGELPNGTATVTVYGIGYEFSQPVRSPQRLRTGAQQFLAYHPSPIIDISWYQALSEPVRVAQRLQAAANPAFFYQPTPIIDISWFAALSEPKRFKPALPEASQSFYTAEPQPEDLDVMGWFAPLSEPKRFAPRLDPSMNPSVTISQQSFYTPYARGYVIC